MKTMKRRDFLKDIAIGSMLINIPSSILSQENSLPDLSIIQGESPSAITKESAPAPREDFFAGKKHSHP